jgi:putative transposase
VDIPDGWYHISARGTDGRVVFTDDRERTHFVELLEEMTRRYKVLIHAYVLMGNHYHLLIQTPEANASRAMQWLQVSYSMWFNRRHERVGPLFQGRFKSVPVDGDGIWALDASVYVHLNPVRVKSLGLGKIDRKAEGRGIQSPSEETLRQRLKKLRKYRWSSYRAYAGYAGVPEWLTTEELLRRGKGRRGYRHYVMEWATGGRDAESFEGMRERWALGGEAFKERLRRGVKRLAGEQPARRHFARMAGIADIVRVVETEVGRKWNEFSEEHGDPGRDLVLYLARKRSGLALREIGEQTGLSNYKTVSSAARRCSARMSKDASLRRLAQKCLTQLQNSET